MLSRISVGASLVHSSRHVPGSLPPSHLQCTLLQVLRPHLWTHLGSGGLGFSSSSSFLSQAGWLPFLPLAPNLEVPSIAACFPDSQLHTGIEAAGEGGREAPLLPQSSKCSRKGVGKMKHSGELASHLLSHLSPFQWHQ